MEPRGMPQADPHTSVLLWKFPIQQSEAGVPSWGAQAPDPYLERSRAELLDLRTAVANAQAKRVPQRRGRATRRVLKK